MIKAGALDCLDNNRARLFDNIENILRHMASASETKSSAQASLFGMQEMSSEIKLKNCADWPDLERLQNEAAAIGFYLSAHPLDVYSGSVERLGIVNYADAVKNMKSGDSLSVNMAGCLQSITRKTGKTGKPFAILKLSDASSSYEGMLFSEGMKRFEAALESGLPLFVQARIDKQSDDLPARIMFNVIKTLDEAITENSKGLIIYLKDISAVRPVRDLLMHEHYGANKIYIKPELDDWDVRIQLKNGYALDNGMLMSSLRAVPGVSLVKEI